MLQAFNREAEQKWPPFDRPWGHFRPPKCTQYVFSCPKIILSLLEGHIGCPGKIIWSSHLAFEPISKFPEVAPFIFWKVALGRKNILFITSYIDRNKLYNVYLCHFNYLCTKFEPPKPIPSLLNCSPKKSAVEVTFWPLTCYNEG